MQEGIVCAETYTLPPGQVVKPQADLHEMRVAHGAMAYRKAVRMAVPAEVMCTGEAEGSVAVHQHAKIWLKLGRGSGTEVNGACGEAYEVHVVWEWNRECDRECGAVTPEEVKYRCAIWRTDSKEGSGKERST